jgi:hypothetical protein
MIKGTPTVSAGPGRPPEDFWSMAICSWLCATSG